MKHRFGQHSLSCVVVPQEVQEVWQWQLGQGWLNRAGIPQQGQGAGTHEQREDGLIGLGQDGDLGWAEAEKQSFDGWVLIAVAYTEQCSPAYGVC